MFKPKNVLIKYFRDSSIKPPYFAFAAILFGISYGIDRVDTQLMKMDFYPERTFLKSLNNWGNYWMVSIFVGLLGGIFTFYLHGWFYNLRVKWSKGIVDIKKARLVNMYVSNVLDFAMVYIALCSTILLSNPVVESEQISAFDVIILTIALIFIGLSISASFQAATILFNTKRSLSVFWFIILPSFFYIFAFAAIIGAYLIYFDLALSDFGF